METAMMIASLIFMLVGFIFAMRGMWLRKPNHPSISGMVSWRMNLMPWRYKEYWEPSGYKLYFSGILLFELGIVISFVIQWTGR